MSVTRILPYTMSRLLEGQRAVIIRDLSTPDAYGASAAEDWQPVATVPCLFWMDREGPRGPAKLFSTPAREIALSEGGLILPARTDITERDRIAKVTDPAGGVVAYGPFDVIAVFQDSDHVEVAWKRATEARVIA